MISPVQNLVRRRKCPLHLIVYNAIVGQRTFFILKMIVPAFLTEDLLLSYRYWDKKQHPDTHASGSGNPGHCSLLPDSRSCPGRSWHLKRYSKNPLPALQMDPSAGTHGNRRVRCAPEYVELLCCLAGGGAKRNGKYLVLIIVLDQDQSCSGFLVAEQIACGMDVCKIFLCYNFVCRNVLYFHFFLQKSSLETMPPDRFYFLSYLIQACKNYARTLFIRYIIPSSR